MNSTSQPPAHVATRYWYTLDDGRIQCDVCPRACKLHEGQQGLCFVRSCHEQKIVLNTYGRSSGFCIDPIEKKPLNHYLPGTPVLSFGTAGCNLACKFCQNWDMSKSREIDTLADSAMPEQLSAKASQMGCRSIAYTYNDPVIFMEYAIDVAKECRKHNIKNIAVTAGYICPEPRKEFFAHMDAANIDLKGFTEGFYYRLCGGHLKDVLDTLLYLKHETDVWFELTTLLIPDQNDSSAEIETMSKWIVDNLGDEVPIHFTTFHPDWKMRNIPPTPAATLTDARDIAIANGVRYAYTGNVHDNIGSSTYCHHCHQRLIERDWYQLGEWNLDSHQCCNQCGAHLPGLFETQPGTWGAKREAVILNPLSI